MNGNSKVYRGKIDFRVYARGTFLPFPLSLSLKFFCGAADVAASVKMKLSIQCRQVFVADAKTNDVK